MICTDLSRGGWQSSKDFWPIINELTWVHSEIGLDIRLLHKLQIFWQDLSDMPSVCAEGGGDDGERGKWCKN